MGRRPAPLVAFLFSWVLHELVISIPLMGGLRPADALLPLLFHPPFLAGVVWPLLGPGA